MNLGVWQQLLASRKVRVALVATVLNFLAVLGLDPEQYRPLVTGIMTIAGVVIAAIAHEDAAAKRAGNFNPENFNAGREPEKD